MKKLLLMLALTPAFGFAQMEETNANVHFTQTSPSMQVVESQSKAATCGPDTVEYTLAKATGLSALSINNATSGYAVSQYFNCPQTITLSGVEFFAYKLDATGGTTIPVTVNIYTAGVDSLPTGAPLASTTVTVDTNFYGGDLESLSKFANFFPVNLNAPYVVVVENNTANGIGLLFSDYQATPVPDGLQEWLCGINIAGTWYNSYDINVGGVPLDCDALFNPLVSYTLDAGFTPSANCFSGGPTINFTNTSSPIVQDRMYNVAAFLNLTSLSYTWDFGDGGGGNAIDTANTYANTTMGYTVVLTDSLFGWTSTCVDSESSFIGDDLATDWNSVPAGGGAVNFTDASTSSAPVTSWLWDFGDGNTSTMQNPIHTYAATGTYTVCLTAVTACGVDSSCAVVNVTVCSNPAAAFSETNNDPSFDFVDGSTTTGVVTYSWNFGDGNTSTQQNPTHTYVDNGTYTVTLVITDDCGVDSVSTTITVNNGCTDPVANFSQSGSEPTFTFTNTSTSSTNTTYSWDMGDGNTYTTQDVTHTYTANGTYTVTLTVTDDCGTHTTTQTVTVSTIGLLDLESDAFVAYPNPANEVLNVQSGDVVTSVELMDMAGRIVVSMECNTMNVEVKTAHLAEGHYTLRATHENGAVKVLPIEVIH